MATGIILCIIVIVFIISVKSYINKIFHGCCGGEVEKVKKIKPSDKNISNYEFSYKVIIDGITCSNCKKIIENSFNEKNGYYARVSLKDKSAVVRVKHKVSENEIKDIINNKGYKATAVINI